MLPAVEASVWASGSQVWRGTSGNLIAKLRRNAAYSQSPTTGSSAGSDERGQAEGIDAALIAVDQVDADDGKQHEQRSGQGEDKELDRRVDFAAMAPDADQEKHRDQHRLPEEVEQKEVEGEEYP